MHDDLVQERWRLLDHQLLDWSCQQQLEEVATVDVTATTTTNKDQLNARSPLLTTLQTLSSTELTDDNVPVPESVQEYARTLLNTLTLLQHAAQTSEWPMMSLTSLLDATMGDDTDATAKQRHQLEHARWWLLGMIVSLMHTRVLEEVITATQPLSSAMTYWDRRINHPRWAAIHLLQTAPLRVTSWITQLRLSQSYSATDTGSLFGHVGIYMRHLINHLPRWPAQGWISLAQREANLKRNRLNDTRRRYAVGLGYLAEQGQVATLDFNQQATAMATPMNNELDHKHAASKPIMSGVKQIRYLLSQLLHCTNHTMQIVLKDAVEKKIPSDWLITVSDMELQPLSAEEVRFSLLTLEEDLEKFKHSNRNILQVDGRPHFLTRYWPVLGAGLVIGPSLFSLAIAQRHSITRWIQEAGNTTRDFLIEWVWRPLQNIYETVRHREGRLNIMGKASLAADLDSLERMVVDLAQEKGQMNEQELDLVRQTVRDGDLSIVLREYEKEMKTPLKSALLGHLIRVLLIQVQKGKVDLELAMAALDKLLRANELNFAFLTAAPVILITFGLSHWINQTWRRRQGFSAGIARQEARDWLRRTDRVLNRCYDPISLNGNGNEPVRQSRILTAKSLYQAHGLVLCNTYRLRALLPRLALNEQMQREFLMDLRELENTGMSTGQRLGTLHRMYRTYTFLMPLAMNYE
ncbi:ATP synthase regulation protein NCA2-domain-containing protein [Syncephalis fuscata]|nr:ATP synthase regulation protein NCA2-domain-containing protein [Syncephalis fuscata]